MKYLEKFINIANDIIKIFELENLIIYSPEETALRNLYREGQIEPLGIHGEGLLKLIKVLDDDSSDIPIGIIKETLSALGWFEDIDVSSSEVGFAEEENIRICDRLGLLDLW